MKTATLWFGAAALMLTAACNSRTSSDPDRQAGNTITLTGCLQSGEQGLASPEPNSASRSAEGVDRFVLANARIPASPAESPSASDASTGQLYILEGKTDELRTHVGQQVEVTGKPGDDRSSSPDPNQPNAQRLEVESVRMIAANCATS